MQRRELEQWLVACYRHAKVIERIVRGRLSDKCSRSRIKWVKGAKRQSNLRTGRGVWRGNCNATGINCKGVIRRDEERRAARGLKTTRGDWRQFVMRFRIHIIKVAVNPKQIVADLRFES